MSKYLWILAFLSLASGCFSGDSTSNPSSDEIAQQHSHTETYYTCSMHPQVKMKEPGKCPICHMNLTLVEVDRSEGQNSQAMAHSSSAQDSQKELWQCRDQPDITSEQPDPCPVDGTPMIKVATQKAAQVVAKVKLKKSQIQHFKPEVFPVTSMKMNKEIRLLGSVLQSEDRESNIPARIGGRVEKVYIKSTGSFVRVGDPVVALYSPKLITAGEEYLLARKSAADSKNKEFQEMLAQSTERLRLWGIKKFQYENWYRSQKVPNAIIIYSSATGIVQKRNAVVGKYFKEGQNFFELSNLSDVWVEMDVYEHDANLVKIGQNVRLKFTAIPGQIMNGEIDFVSPTLSQVSRTLKVRATISNQSGHLKPGMVADATLKIKFDEMPLVIPRSAVIDTGKRKVAWVKVNPNTFQAKIIQVGLESEGYVEVKSGLQEGQEVVIDGNFLLDAQAQLFGGYQEMTMTHAHGR